MTKPAILLIDDAAMMRQFITIFLADKYEVTSCETAEEAKQLIEGGFCPNLVVTDLQLPGMTGQQMIKTLLVTMPTTPLIAISGSKDSKTRLETLSAGADDFLTKPFHPAELAVRIGKQLEKGKPQATKTQPMLTVYSRLRRVAATF